MIANMVVDESHFQGLFLLCDDEYDVVKFVGKGSYGAVVKAFDRKSNNPVAIKCIPLSDDDPGNIKKTIREFLILHSFKFKYIISLLDVRVHNGNAFLISEYCDFNMSEIIQSHIQNPFLRDPSYYLNILHQLLEAVRYIHSAGVIHRDIKPANILIDSSFNVKLCDFGLARVIGKNQSVMIDASSEPITEYVVTRWYRAPEVVLNPGKYGKANDIWGVACAIGELICLTPLFPGRTVVHQLQVIIDGLGNLKDDDLNFEMNPRARKYAISIQSENIGLSQLEANSFDLHHDLFPFLKKMLCFNPFHRITADNALKSSIFDGCKQSKHEKIFPVTLPKFINDTKIYTTRSKEMNLNILENFAKYIHEDLMDDSSDSEKEEEMKDLRQGNVIHTSRDHIPHASKGYLESSKVISTRPPRRGSLTATVPPSTSTSTASRTLEGRTCLSTKSLSKSRIHCGSDDGKASEGSENDVKDGDNNKDVVQRQSLLSSSPHSSQLTRKKSHSYDLSVCGEGNIRALGLKGSEQCLNDSSDPNHSNKASNLGWHKGVRGNRGDEQSHGNNNSNNDDNDNDNGNSSNSNVNNSRNSIFYRGIHVSRSLPELYTHSSNIAPEVAAVECMDKTDEDCISIDQVYPHEDNKHHKQRPPQRFLRKIFQPLVTSARAIFTVQRRIRSLIKINPKEQSKTSQDQKNQKQDKTVIEVSLVKYGRQPSSSTNSTTDDEEVEAKRSALLLTQQEKNKSGLSGAVLAIPLLRKQELRDSIVRRFSPIYSTSTSSQISYTPHEGKIK